MKKIDHIHFISVAIIMCVMVLLTGCDKKLESTDLSNIYVDNMTINTKINSEDLLKYTNSDRYSGNYKYKFEEIIIDVDNNNEINYLFSRFDENYTDIKVNGKEVKTIDDVKNILGNNYQEKNYDKEQQLKECIYKDNDKNMMAEFVFSINDGKLVFIILNS